MARPVSRVSRVLMTGPLTPYADAYRAELRGRGYTALSAVNELRQVGRLSAWLAASGTTVGELSVAGVDEFLEQQRAPGRRASWSRRGLVCMVEFLRSLGVVGRGAVVGVLRALLAGRAWPCVWHGPRVRGPCSAVRGRARPGWRDRLGDRDGGDVGGAARVGCGVGGGDAELRGRVEVVPAFLFRGGAGRAGSLAGRAGDHGTSAVVAASGYQRRRRAGAAGQL